MDLLNLSVWFCLPSTHKLKTKLKGLFLNIIFNQIFLTNTELQTKNIQTCHYDVNALHVMMLDCLQELMITRNNILRNIQTTCYMLIKPVTFLQQRKRRQLLI